MFAEPESIVGFASVPSLSSLPSRTSTATSNATTSCYNIEQQTTLKAPVVNNQPTVKPTSISELNARSAVVNALPTLVSRNYQIKSLVGWGMNGAVVEATTSSTSAVAIKIVYKLNNNIPNEIAILSNLPQHNNIVHYIDSFQDDSFHYLVTELVLVNSTQSTFESEPIMTIFDGVVYGIPIRQPSSSSESNNTTTQATHAVSERDIVLQLVNGLNHLHSNNVTHGDIKLSNLLISQEEDIVKYCDFGFAVSSGYRTFYGSSAMSPPELLQPFITQKWSGKEADVWALGLVLLKLFYPQCTSDHSTFINEASGAPYNGCYYPGCDNISDDDKLLKSLLMGMLAVDPAQRLTVNDILCHPFLV